MGILSALVRAIQYYPEWQEDKKIEEELKIEPIIRIRKFGYASPDIFVSSFISVYDIDTYTDNYCTKIAPEGSKVFNTKTDDLQFLQFVNNKMIIYNLINEYKGYKDGHKCIVDKSLEILCEVPYSNIKNCELLNRGRGWKLFHFNLNECMKVNKFWVTAFIFLPYTHISFKQQKNLLRQYCDKHNINRRNF
ncbi:MAG: hypothetical protein LBG80_10240 [Bacteroidales bacterium]|jgi:hypothetical protein|nr:hypothetical protein [Bacteroidales bacterium]